MSASLSVASILEKNRVDSDVPWLFLLDIEVIDPETGDHVITLNLARNTEPVQFNGLEYTPTMFDISLKQSLNEQSNLQLSVNDYSQSVQAYMQAYAGGVGFKVTMYIVDGSALNLPAELVEFFEVQSASASEFVATFQLGMSNMLTAQFPRRKQARDFCQWRFKDGNCRYQGPATSCDYTLQGPNGCSVKGTSADGVVQTIRFGAYPGINSNGIRYG